MKSPKELPHNLKLLSSVDVVDKYNLVLQWLHFNLHQWCKRSLPMLFDDLGEGSGQDNLMSSFKNYVASSPWTTTFFTTRAPWLKLQEEDSKRKLFFLWLSGEVECNLSDYRENVLLVLLGLSIVRASMAVALTSLPYWKLQTKNLLLLLPYYYQARSCNG